MYVVILGIWMEEKSMNKKRFVISIFFVVAGLIIVSSSKALAKESPDPTLDQLHKSSKYTGLMENMKSLYDDFYIVAQNVKSNGSFLGHDLIFDLKDAQSQNYDQVKTELTGTELAEQYRNKHVDIFGTNYYVNCYFSENEKVDGAKKGKTCMYGGLTLHDGNHLDNGNPQAINVQVFENNHNPLTFTIHTDKKRVTAQELDIKTRHFLISKLKLYEYYVSPYETGYIKFIEKGSNTFWYDMMPPPGDKFDQSKYLLMYRDNKVVESKDVKIEVHLTKK